MRSNIRRLFVLWWVITTLSMAGCIPSRKPTVLSVPAPIVQLPSKLVYHKVHKGETLWRIAKTYGVLVDDVIRANRIPNAASIEENQLLLIPGADEVRNVDLPGPVVKDNEFSWPVHGKVVSYYEDRRGGYFNRGIDIKLSEDDMIKASRDGRVVFADHLAGYGYAVILDHTDGFYSVYGRSEKLLVSVGDYVTRGERIAVPVHEGGQAFLHFEIRKGGDPSNPLYYLP